MKVYVDEKDNGTTVTYKEENGKRQYLYVHDKEGFIFKSLADYTKQVRKEVVQDIRKKLKDVKFVDTKTVGNLTIGITIDEILDQIQD